MDEYPPTRKLGPSTGGTTPTEGAARYGPLPVETLNAALPQFEVLKMLGQGGMGAVYQARQITLNRLVAIKVLPEIGADAHFADRFAREAHALARLSHPHIVTVHDAGRTATGIYYLVMEYVDGTDLRKALRGGLMSPERALHIVPAICDALIYAHQEGIVHRDIKPENILLDHKGRVKIVDFGLAKLTVSHRMEDSLTATRQVLGTPYYMAPEQARGGKDVDHRADIYALGVVFYEMLTGELPRGHFLPPSEKAAVDRRLDPVVLRSMASDPRDRYQQVSDLKTDVERITNTQTPAPDAAPPPEESAQPVGERLSGMAITGAIWGCPFLLSHGLGISWFNVGIIGKTAPAGATVLGILAVLAIRRSSGRLYGMRLATGAALLLPLILLNHLLRWGMEWAGIARLPLFGLWWFLLALALDVWVVFRLAARWGPPRATGLPSRED